MLRLLVDISLALDLLPADPVRFIPVQLRLPDSPCAQPHKSDPLQLPPPTSAIQPLEPGDISDSAAHCDRRDLISPTISKGISNHYGWSVMTAPTLIRRISHNAKALSGRRSRSVQTACYAASLSLTASTAVAHASCSLALTRVRSEHPQQKSNNENARKRDFSIGMTFHHRAKHEESSEP
jgi:hypothetical protein